MRCSLQLSLAAGLGFLFCSIVSAAEPTREQTTVSGIIVDGKGVAVAGAKVKVLLDRSIIATRSDGLGKFQLEVPKNQAARLAILATAPNAIGVLRMPGESDASRTANVRIQLVESRPLEVSVTDENKRPIAGAQVGALIDQVELPFSETSAQGKASLQLPVRARYLAVFAHKAGHGLDYCVLELVRRHANARGWPDDGRLSLSLSPPRRVTIRAKSEEGGRPLPGVELRPEFLVKPGEPASCVEHLKFFS
jgi:hypothetical protein